MNQESRPPHVVSQKETWEYIKSRPDDLEKTVTLGIAMGSTLRTIAKTFGIPFPWLYEHIQNDLDFSRKYEMALKQRDEYMKQFLFDQYKLLAESDLRLIFNEDGSLKAPKDWPDSVAQFISSIETDELFEGSGRDRIHIGFTKKVKLWDKSKALEQLAKHFKFTVDQSSETGRLSWEEIIKMQAERERAKIEAARPVTPSPDEKT